MKTPTYHRVLGTIALIVGWISSCAVWAEVTRIPFSDVTITGSRFSELQWPSLGTGTDLQLNIRNRGKCYMYSSVGLPEIPNGNDLVEHSSDPANRDKLNEWMHQQAGTFVSEGISDDCPKRRDVELIMTLHVGKRRVMWFPANVMGFVPEDPNTCEVRPPGDVDMGTVPIGTATNVLRTVALPVRCERKASVTARIQWVDTGSGHTDMNGLDATIKFKNASSNVIDTEADSNWKNLYAEITVTGKTDRAGEALRSAILSITPD